MRDMIESSTPEVQAGHKRSRPNDERQQQQQEDEEGDNSGGTHDSTETNNTTSHDSSTSSNNSNNNKNKMTSQESNKTNNNSNNNATRKTESTQSISNNSGRISTNSNNNNNGFEILNNSNHDFVVIDNNKNEDDEIQNNLVALFGSNNKDMDVSNRSSHSGSRSSNLDDSSSTRSVGLERARDLYHYCNKIRLASGKIINSERVQTFIIFLIVVNAIMMGIGTFSFVIDDPDVSNIFEIVDKVFLVIFTIELILQFSYFGYQLFFDGWLVFDLFVITMSWAFENVQIIRAFRIFRALRLVTRIKVMKNLVLALFSVMPRMAAIGLLLFIIFYIFAVMFTSMFKDLYHDGETDEDYFSRLDSTFFTLFQLMTMDNWASITRQVMAVFSWAWLPILAFLIITGFIVVNLIIAVICDAVAALDKDEKDNLMGDHFFGGDDDDDDEDDADDDDIDDDTSSRLNNEEDEEQVEEEEERKQHLIESTRDNVNVCEQLNILDSHIEQVTKTQEGTIMMLTQLTSELIQAKANIELLQEENKRLKNENELYHEQRSSTEQINLRSSEQKIQSELESLRELKQSQTK